MLDDGRIAEVPPAFRGNPRIEALRSNHNRLTRSAVRRAAEGHAAIVVVLDGGKRAVAAFNMNKQGNLHMPVMDVVHSADGLRFGGKGYLDWMLERNDLVDVGIQANEGSHIVVYAGSTDPEDLRDPRNMGMDEPEFTMDGLLGAGMALVGGDDVGRPDGAPLPMASVEAIVGYEPTEVVYARDAAWRSLVWKKNLGVIM